MRVFHRNKSGGYYVFQDADETIDYKIDWTAWLKEDSIAEADFKTSGVTVTSSQKTDTATTVWIKGSGGSVIITITTALGRVKQLTVGVKEKVA